MHIGVFIIGDEILSGRRQDRHFGHAIELLGRRRLRLDWVRLVGDDIALLTQHFREIWRSGDLCFSFGGIGATPDDLTRQCVAAAHDVPIVQHPEAKAEIEARFGEAAYPTRIRMADLPQGARMIPNPVNRIPGFSLGHIHCLPGFPHMAWPMMEWVLDHHYAGLRQNKPAEYSVTVHDVPESYLVDWMTEFLLRHPGLKIFSLPRFLDDGHTEIELGVKGERDAARAALTEVKKMLDAKGYRYSG